MLHIAASIWYNCRAGREQNISVEQNHSLMSRATQVFRQEHINKLSLAREELDNRCGKSFYCCPVCHSMLWDVIISDKPVLPGSVT